jgi:hypothetical protein
METRTTVQNPFPESHGIGQGLWRLTLAGGAAFWIVDFAMALSPIAKEYRAAFSISSLSLALVEALAGGLLIGGCASYFLLRFFDRIPSNKPILKAMILSLAAMLLVEGLSTLMDPGHAFTFLVIDTAMNLPRFLVLGIAIGYQYTLIKKGKRS